MKKINRIRLIADDGMILINGDSKGYVVDIDENDDDKWTEMKDVKDKEDKAEGELTNG